MHYYAVVYADDETLQHHGIWGQKWGIRRFQNPDGTLTEAGKKRYNRSLIGEKTGLLENKDGVLAKFLGSFSEKIREQQRNYHDYKITDKEGHTVGNISTCDEMGEKKGEINIVWVGIKPKYENRGYGTDALRTVIDDAKQRGLKYVTLEVPTNSPNARHIYEKMGFKDTGEAMLGDEDDVWGGLTKMRMKIG